MAAYASLVSLMRVIHDLETHPSPPISLDKQLLDSITQRITYFQQFLHSYISLVADDDEEAAADPLEMRIAAAAHAAEDAIEFHIVDCIKQKKRYQKEANDDEKYESINQCCGVLKSVIEEMDSIKNVLLDDTQKTKKVPLAMTNFTASSVVAPSETTMVGSDAVVLEIMEKLAGDQLDRQVISIVGMGGIGKTFLAKTIYANQFIKDRFPICAWATISQNYDTREILRELLSQVTNKKKEQLSGESVDELGSELRKCLFTKRFLVVMDDMWSIDSWDDVQRYIPNNGKGSRVLVTTRLSQLSLQLNNDDFNLRMSFLDKASSWELFSKAVFGDKSSCPPELEEIGEKIVDNCRGLPLSIAVVGGLLKKTEATQASWESIRDNFTSVVNMDNDKHCLRLLKLSYNHLPVYLKPCFLYMGVFEEDEEIHVATLVQLWISEGFIEPTNGEALETTARRFLQDLVDRNLILIGKLGSTGGLRFCKMHDLLRDMCLEECGKQGFYHVIGQCNSPPHPQRRVVIPKDSSTAKQNLRGDLKSMPHTRSIYCEGVKDIPLCRNLVLLRTLQSQKKGVKLSDSKIYLQPIVLRYVNLRHLTIRAPRLSSFLPSVSRLWNLQTLVVYYTSVFPTTWVLDIWKMPRIRHIEFAEGFESILDPPNCDDGIIMENLHTLKGVYNFKCSEDMVKRIPNIKRLKLMQHGSNDTSNACVLRNIKDLRGLEFLSVNIFLRRSISCIEKITFPHSLKKLSLSLSNQFKQDDMLEKIGSLPFLEKLKLRMSYFKKGTWEIAEEQFPNLKYLEMNNFDGLEKWKASEEGASIFPRLEHLHLDSLSELKEIPIELGNIDTLKSIKLIDCGEGAVKSAKKMFDEQVELQGGEDQLSFHVDVTVTGEELEHLLSFAGPKFYVKLIKPSVNLFESLLLRIRNKFKVT